MAFDSVWDFKYTLIAGDNPFAELEKTVEDRLRIIEKVIASELDPEDRYNLNRRGYGLQQISMLKALGDQTTTFVS